MNKLNLNPVTKTDRPTSELTLRKRKVGSSKIVVAEHRNTKAYFYVDAEREVMGSTLQNSVYLHENITDLFGGLDHGAPFHVHTGAGLSDVPSCDRVQIHTDSPEKDQLKKALRSPPFLIHRGIEEVTEVGGGLVAFDVVSMEPRNYTTLVVTDSTDIEFVSASEADQMREPAGGGGPTGPGGGQGGSPGGRGGGGGNDEAVDIDVSPEKPTVSFEEDVAGLESVKETARMLLALFDPDTKAEVVSNYGESFASQGGSMLLYGPPGCGKTLVSEAIAYEAANNTNIEDEYGDVQFLPVKGGDILSRYPGEAERRVEAVFDEAHQVAQEGFAVLFFDEIETLIPDRSDDDLQRHERSLTNAFLQEMDTDKMEDNLLVIGATNMPFTIDPAASRRFPLQQFIPQPGEEVMSQVWSKELSALEAANEGVDIDYDRLAEASIGYTPAEITDRVLGTELQRDLVRSVISDDREAVVPDTDYLLTRLEDHDPKTVRQFVTSVRDQADALEGYPEMRDYVEDQTDRLGISMGGTSLVDQITAAAGGDNGESEE
jgi:transitional endoplasmic reticulum ATPase